MQNSPALDRELRSQAQALHDRYERIRLERVARGKRPVGPGERASHIRHAEDTITWLGVLLAGVENSQSERDTRWAVTLRRRIAALEWLIGREEAREDG